MVLSVQVLNYKDPKFCDDTIINCINQFVTLHKDEKKLNTSHVEKVIKGGLIPLMKKQDTLFEQRFKYIIHGGSYYKNTKIGKPDEYDLNFIIHLPWREETLKFETPQNKSGFVKIQLTENSKLPEWDIYHRSQLAKFVDKKCYLDQNNFRKWVESVFCKTLNMLPQDRNSNNSRILELDNMMYSISLKKSGPAFTLIIKVSEGHVIHVDMVVCLEFSILPPKRYKNFKHEMGEWMVIPKPLSEVDGNLMWKLSFCKHEKHVLKGPIITVIRLLKKLRDTQNWKNLASYYIETLALHELKSHDPSLMELPLTCLFMHILKKLGEATKAYSIKFFWCNEMNLLDRVSEKEIKNIADRLKFIIAKIERSIDNDPYIIASFIFLETVNN